MVLSTWTCLNEVKATAVCDDHLCLCLESTEVITDALLLTVK